MASFFPAARGQIAQVFLKHAEPSTADPPFPQTTRGANLTYETVISTFAFDTNVSSLQTTVYRTPPTVGLLEGGLCSDIQIPRLPFVNSLFTLSTMCMHSLLYMHFVYNMFRLFVVHLSYRIIPFV